jgi:hypothetical protein
MDPARLYDPPFSDLAPPALKACSLMRLINDRARPLLAA